MTPPKRLAESPGNLMSQGVPLSENRVFVEIIKYKLGHEGKPYPNMIAVLSNGEFRYLGVHRGRAV